jgi:hypothetical protein
MIDVGGLRVAVGGVAIGLIAFVAGAAGILATGHTVPAEYWSAGSAISGALLGILAPAPVGPKRAKAANSVAAADVATAHAQAAKDAAAAAKAATGETLHAAAAAFDRAAEAHATALETVVAAGKSLPASLTGVVPLLGLLIVFGVSLWAGIEYEQTQLQALAAAAGGALLGLLSPSPAKAP